MCNIVELHELIHNGNELYGHAIPPLRIGCIEACYTATAYWSFGCLLLEADCGTITEQYACTDVSLRHGSLAPESLARAT